MGGIVMAWIARDEDNTLIIYADKPIRRTNVGCFAVNQFMISHDFVELPSDTDEKLIGRHIDWEDEPVEI